MARPTASRPRAATAGAGDEPVDRVAARTGVGSPAATRRHMRYVLGVSPRAYRDTSYGSA
ncbi:hypothetical protein [Streptomyces mutabilis]|uniref:HTH araC/xylS-type domain-containing protein n=1 Tax=Streptomyces mutabilis TaxID=67332 RepID=A0A086MSX1_9ACTN|nr:hypothetical protein [Streptomyces mutabilis]KFG71989.1 hypothetical protein FM21_31005 [Streptomyces mutabilis]